MNKNNLKSKNYFIFVFRSMLMTVNPFELKPVNFEKTVENLSALYPKPYRKEEVNPYTKLRIIMMNGAEYESIWFSHRFFRQCDDNDIRRTLALIRSSEQQQQKTLSCLKPLNESILETTIGYEHLAVDLTSALAVRERNPYVKQALDFALLEDFDHLYRYANLLEYDRSVRAEKLIGKLAEIMPGRPTVAEHRFPADDVKNSVDYKNADISTKLCIATITAAEQQTMNYYMNIAQFYNNDLGRQIYSEIGLIEEEHVTLYGSLSDATLSFAENLLLHEYTEAYLYYSCLQSETDLKIKKIWEANFEKEVLHLNMAARLLEKYEKKDYRSVIPSPEFPIPLVLSPCVDYVRETIKNTIENTGYNESYINVKELPKEHRFFDYNAKVAGNTSDVPTHIIIDKHISDFGKDYRYEVKNYPIEEMGNRKNDNTEIARTPAKKTAEKKI